MPRRVILFLVALLMLTAPGSASSTPAMEGFCYRYSPRDYELVERINHFRDAHEERKLVLDPELSRVARKHANEMAASATLFHTPSETLQRRVTRWVALGESTQKGLSVDRAFAKLTNQRRHRANMLNKEFVYLGVAAHRTDDLLWVDITYEARNDPGTTLRMPRC